MVTGGDAAAAGPDPQDARGSVAARMLPLDVLSRSVRDARAAVHQHRHGPVTAELANARRDLVHALQEYTAALEDRHLPVPYALRSELRLHRQLFD
jgi:hypothetical protein